MQSVPTMKIIISLTSFPVRINTVDQVIKTLLVQTMKPWKIVLWLTHDEFPEGEKSLPEKLLALTQGTCFEIDWSEKNYRPYNKLIHTLHKYPDCAIVTVDDDIIYKPQLLERLYEAYEKDPFNIHCHRVTKFIYEEASFRIVRGGHEYYPCPSYLNKPTGVGGVLYPPHCFHEDVLREDVFLRLAPTQDDQWFWAMAVMMGRRFHVVPGNYAELNYVPGTQDHDALYLVNDCGEATKFWACFNNIVEAYPNFKARLVEEGVAILEQAEVVCHRETPLPTPPLWRKVARRIKRPLKKIAILSVKTLARLKSSWRLFYFILLRIQSQPRRERFWKKLSQNGIVARFPDKGFWICNTFVYTGERYKLPGKGGGIYSAINWQRMNWSSDLPRLCTDKLAVREYVKKHIGNDFLIPIIPSEGVYWTDVEEIDFNSLPNRFVLKLNNGSGMNLIVKDKSKIDIQKTKNTLSRWLSSHFGERLREHQYDGIENKLYCERFLDTLDGNPPDDYKIMCNNGKPLFIWVDTGRHNNHQRSFFDLQFRKLDVRVAHDYIDHEIQKPKNLDKMLEIASNLSAGIPIVRIDLYNIEGKIYFGEMTFTSAACSERYEPLSFSIGIGNKIDLSPFL